MVGGDFLGEKGGGGLGSQDDTEQDPVGLPGHKNLPVSPVSLIIGNRPRSASMIFPEFLTGEFKRLLIMEGKGFEIEGEIIKRKTIV